MRICRVSKRLRPQIGGIENHVHFLSFFQTRAGHNVTLVVPNVPNAPPQKNYEIQRVIPFILKPMAGMGLIPKALEVMKIAIFSITAILYCIIAMRTRRYQILHVHGDRQMALIAGIIGKLTGCRTVLTVHSDLGRISGSSFNFLFKFPGALIGVSDKIKAQLSRLTGRNDLIYSISSGVMPEFFRFETPKIVFPHRLAFVGRLRPSKGVDVLLRAVRIVRNRIPDVELHVIGDGSALQLLMDLCSELDIDDHVIFDSGLTTRELVQILKQSAVFVMPSIQTPEDSTEGRPTAIMEAMCLGVPVIGTDVGGIPELIKNGKNGLVVKERDETALAAAIICILSNESQRARMSKSALQARDQFSWQSIVQRVMVVYEDILCKPR